MNRRIRVAVADFPPLVSTRDGKREGFEIDLWEAIARQAGFDFEYESLPFKEILPLLSQGKVDVGLAGITVSEDRETVVDFSHHTLDSGLLVSVAAKRNRLSALKTVRALFRDHRSMIGSTAMAVAAFVLAFGNMLWIAERGSGAYDPRYLPGVFEAIWFMFSSVSSVGYGDFMPVTWTGRAITAAAIVGGLALFGVFVSQITSLMTVKKMRGHIDGPKDLPGKKVATVEGSTSEAFLRAIGAHVSATASLADAYSLLHRGEADAVVFDAPAVLYYEKQSGKDFHAVGDLFERQSYAIAVRQPSPLTEDINRALLTLKETGAYAKLYRKWFGEDPKMEI